MSRLPRGVPEARHRVQKAMRSWGEPDERIETAALVVTELVTNAVQHTASRRIRCRLLRSPGGVRICVWNRSRRRVSALPRPRDPARGSHAPRAPLPRRPEPHGVPDDGPHPASGTGPVEGPGPVARVAPDAMPDPGCFDLASVAEDGRGLMLVDALAARWGTRSSLSGRLVWADV
ncbi:ATP-binding protein [Streptomyces sp. NPDC049970]|uniref:ATP-binding protein n=1 Tax=Streptomyces sp. NPDC049970 TaxID=3155033 RepID=UPI00343299CE